MFSLSFLCGDKGMEKRQINWNKNPNISLKTEKSVFYLSLCFLILDVGRETLDSQQ